MRELLARIDARELAEWRAFDRLEPFGDARADLRAGHIAAMVANVNLDKKAQPLRPEMFVFGYQPEAENRPSLAEQMRAVLPPPED